VSRRFPPTLRKLRKAREEGDVARAPELTACCVTGAGLLFLGATLWVLQTPIDFEPSGEALELHFPVTAVIGLSAILTGLFFVSLASEMLQTGCQFHFGQLCFKSQRLDLFLGLRRIFGIQNEPRSFFRTPLWEAVKILVLEGAILIPALFSIRSVTAAFELEPSISALLLLALFPIAGVLLSLIAFSALILLCAHLDRRIRLSMDLEELKREMRDSEGREEIRRRRNELLGEIAHGAPYRRPKLIITETRRR